jgi:ATP-dependent Clp protease adaptor protein ClpS
MSTEIKTEERVTVSLQPPALWKVIFLNDDETPMEFVIELLTSIFKHNESSAKEVTLEVHNTGSGVAGVYSHEIAEQKGIEATHVSRANGFPLQINLEQE